MAEIAVKCRNYMRIIRDGAYRTEEKDRGFKGTEEETTASDEEISERGKLEVKGAGGAAPLGNLRRDLRDYLF